MLSFYFQNEDIIKEELLKEKTIEDNLKQIDLSVANIKDQETSEERHFTSEKVNVKPLNGEKSKNSSLYTVSPNYKPLKKIEVLPPKQFVRDPDDNSWRNESLSSLGIVFKPSNSSKPFTQVLKNKTETELNNLSERDSKNDVPDLRERLQKMAEKRKSKKKKTDSYGNVVYVDYEENSNSVENTSKDEQSTTLLPELTGPVLSSFKEPLGFTPPLSSTSQKNNKNSDTSRKYKKFFQLPEYYDTDEDDSDYLNMAKIDIKKFSTSKKTTTYTTPDILPKFTWAMTKPPLTNPPGRIATIQYFPPLTTQKVNFNDYDNDFKHKVNSFTDTESPKNIISTVKPTIPDKNSIHYNIQNSLKLNNNGVTSKPFHNNLYLTQSPLTTRTGFTTRTEDEALDRDAYVIRHYKDFINIAAKNSEYERNLDFIPYTEAPIQGVTKTEVTYETEKPKMAADEALDYDSQFRKDVLQRFVDNFNQDTHRFKTDYPVLFNNSVIHRDMIHGDVASSRAFMRGFYNDIRPKRPQKPLCDPNCENINVDLSPAYELHYYMPEQEEKEAASQSVTLPYPFKLDN